MTIWRSINENGKLTCGHFCGAWLGQELVVNYVFIAVTRICEMNKVFLGLLTQSFQGFLSLGIAFPGPLR
jgi:hypothetical protein